METEPSTVEQDTRKCVSATSAGHSSVGVVAGGGGGWHSAWSQLVVKLVLMSQVDPAEDECGQSQSEHHDEDS